MKKVITFGELMLRLAPENYLRFVQSDKYQATFGGAEANVAVSLANYGIDASFVSKLPTHEIGQSAVNSLRKFGVNTDKIVRGGERVGICGDIINERGSVISIKNFTALCIRFPNQITGCAKEYYSKLKSPKSCLVVSPPFHGKTTFIRDLARAYSDEFDKAVLIIDERDELSAGGNFTLGKNSEVLRFSSKQFGFENGVRALNPEVIVCDEIMTSEDINGVRFALNSGVKVVASTHGDSIENLLKKQGISTILEDNLFEDIIFLESFKIKEIYGGDEWKKLF